jgi:hypothetical protein
MGQKHSKTQTKSVESGEKDDKQKDLIYSIKLTVDNVDSEKSLETRKQLATQLREDPAFLELITWAFERKYKVTIDDQCWLHYSHIEIGFASIGIFSIDDLSSFDVFKASFLKKGIELRKEILRSEELRNGGIITPIIKKECNQSLDEVEF